MTAFWVFMMITVLLVPAAMIGFGSLFLKKAPGRINSLFGYRTVRSMKNMDTWNFAHKYIGKLWRTLGWIMLPLSVIPMLSVYASGADTVGTVAGIVVLIQLLPLVAAIFPVERALKKNFDDLGRRR